MSPEEARETKIEAITAGLIVLVLALFLFGNLTDAWAMLAAGVILLGSGVYQSARGWHVSLTTWLLGVVLFLGGLGVQVFLVAVLRINWVAVALVAIGAYIVWQNVFVHPRA